MSSPHDEIEFGPDDLDAVAARMDDLAAAQRGWVNVQAVVDPEHSPARRSGPLRWLNDLNGRIPDLALGTWMAPTTKGDVLEPATVGLQQPSGHKTVPLLRERNLLPPDGWRLSQDAARRGLIVRAPLDTPNREILEWLTRVTADLTPLPTTGRWIARIYPGR